MKTLYLTIIVILSSYVLLNIDFVSGESVSGKVWFMKSNSVAHLYVEYSTMTPHNETINVDQQIYTGDLGNSTLVKSPDLIMTATPSSINLNTTTQVTYTITTKNNLKGIYWISNDMVTGCGVQPIVIGLNESEVNPSIFFKFFTAVYLCPSSPPNATYATITSFDGIISKVISVDMSKSNLTNNTVPEFPLTIPVLLIGITSLMVFYKIKIHI